VPWAKGLVQFYLRARVLRFFLDLRAFLDLREEYLGLLTGRVSIVPLLLLLLLETLELLLETLELLYVELEFEE